MNENENTPKLQNTAKRVIIGKFITLNTYRRKEKSLKLMILSFTLRILFLKKRKKLMQKKQKKILKRSEEKSMKYKFRKII